MKPGYETASRSIIALLAVLATASAGCDKAGMSSIFHRPGRLRPGQQARFTILLKVFSNPITHAEEAKYYKSQTERLTGWQGMYVESKADHSELYWGKYASQKDASRNLKKAKSYRAPAGVAIYAQAMILPLGEKDFGPPEWDLRNAGGAYTVVVAVFYDVPEADYFGRKEHAVEYCRQLRQKGEQAYYYHGPARSTVAVGSFSEAAVEMVRDGDAERPIVRDPGILAVQSRFPLLAANGREQLELQQSRQTGKLEKRPARTYPARIPRKGQHRQIDALHSLGNTE